MFCCFYSVSFVLALMISSVTVGLFFQLEDVDSDDMNYSYLPT